MSGKVSRQTRAAANQADSATLSINERILKECHILYTDPENGLVKAAQELDLQLLAPRKKITVLLIGNHSAGKSSFINWYLEEHVQRTGVAIETQGFTFVTSGRKRESLTGNATLHLYPHFEPLRQIGGVTDYLTTEISTSKQKKFSLVTFVDTPGLVDGDMKYPFDVNEAIAWLGDLADLIFVFFDPIGQALCKRTLNLVEKLNEKHAERMRFYLSKADEAGHESDRQRVMMQIVQELCKRPGLNRTGFDMPTIYVPNPNKVAPLCRTGRGDATPDLVSVRRHLVGYRRGELALHSTPSRCANQIEEVCKDVEKTINQTIQNTLNQLEKDCEIISEIITEKLEEDKESCSHNLRARLKGMMFGFLGMFLPMVLFINFLASSASRDVLISVLGREGTHTLYMYLSPVRGMWNVIPADYHMYVLIALSLFTLLLLLIAKFSSRRRPTLTRKQKRLMMEKREYVTKHVKNKKESLYGEYLKQSVAEHDL